MKIEGAIAALALGHQAQASLQGVKQALAGILDPHNVTAGRGPLRKLTGNILQEYFIPYGCWCNFDGMHRNKAGQGHGVALDAWDQNCRNLQEGYECAVLDAELRGETCEPWDAEYPTPGAAIDDSIMHTFCAFLATKNGQKDLCVEAACLIETAFVNRVANFIIPGQPAGFTNMAQVNQAYRHDNGFKVEEGCKSTPGSGAQEKACCGWHPTRFPYKDTDEHLCCENDVTGVGKIYNDNTNVCCEDGSIGTIGSDC